MDKTGKLEKGSKKDLIFLTYCQIFDDHLTRNKRRSSNKFSKINKLYDKLVADV